MPRPSNRDDMGLTATEARLLAVLAARHERWATADELIRDGLRYDRDRSSEASLRTHIHNLRTKVGRDTIATARGLGYRLRRPLRVPPDAAAGRRAG